MIRFNHQQDIDAISTAAGVIFNPRCDVCIARADEDGKTIGGGLYTNYQGFSIGCHIAGFTPAWISKDLVWCFFHYGFMQLGVTNIFGQTPSTNERALALNKKLGFKEVVRIPGVFADGDLVVQRMQAQDCKWLKIRPSTVREGS